MYKTEFSKDSLKYLKRLDKSTKDRIIDAIKLLPYGDVKKLQVVNTYRLRVGDYRIIFDKDSKVYKILIIKIAPRGEAY